MQRASFAVFAVLALAACNAGSGTGSASGTIRIAGCRDAETPYDLRPSFFSGEGALTALHVRLQRGSDVTGNSDGIWIDVADASAISAMLHPTSGTAPLDVTVPIAAPTAPDAVSMTLYLGETCNTSYRDVAAVLPSTTGTVTFSAIYDPTSPSSDTAIRGHFEGVVFEDPSDPTGRHAELSGTFDFIYNRGQPAQRFP